MYEARQNKEKVNRRIDVGNVKQQKNKSIIIQKITQITNKFPNFEYMVNRLDYHNGTDTNNITREYVNKLNYNGGYINLTYETGLNPISSFTNSTYINNIPNPKIPLPNRSLWDAGHALPKQIGGLGHSIFDVFPQNPIVNQGNRNSTHPLDPNGNRNYNLWRMHEDNFTKDVCNFGYGRWKITVV